MLRIKLLRYKGSSYFSGHRQFGVCFYKYGIPFIMLNGAYRSLEVQRIAACTGLAMFLCDEVADDTAQYITLKGLEKPDTVYCLAMNIYEKINERKEIKTNNEIQIFNNDSFGTVRTVEVDGTPYFVGKDVAEILGYANINKAIQTHVDNEDKKILDYKGFSHFGKSLWKEKDYSNKTIINESGVYALIFGSKLLKAKEFKRWVTSEILPAIRKHGAYKTAPEEPEKLVIKRKGNSPATLIVVDTGIKEYIEEIAKVTERSAAEIANTLIEYAIQHLELDIGGRMVEILKRQKETEENIS